jgi:hypothetical protein
MIFGIFDGIREFSHCQSGFFPKTVHPKHHCCSATEAAVRVSV